jgi:AraC-like DNA-binding protein
VCCELDEVLNSLETDGENALAQYHWRVLGAVASFIEAVRPCGQGHRRDVSYHERDLLDKVRAYVVAHRDETISVHSAAESLYVSESHLADIVRRGLGKTIKQLHREERLRLASELLTDPRLTITQIAGQCGFSSIHYFSREFKRFYGVPPSRARG